MSALPDGGGVRVTAGDILCTFVKDDQVVTKLALAADTVLSGALTADNRIQLMSKSPTVYLDVLEEGVDGINPFARGQLEQLGSFVATNVVAIVGDLVRNVPVPVIPGATLAGATLTTGDGYLLLSGELR